VELIVAVGDVGKAPKVEDLAQGEGAGRDGELIGEVDAAVWAMLLALAMRQVALATIEQESYLTGSPT
jgi:hypothetical protein